METACSLERGACLSILSVTQKPHKACPSHHLLQCSNGYLSPAFSSKCTKLSSRPNAQSMTSFVTQFVIPSDCLIPAALGLRKNLATVRGGRVSAGSAIRAPLRPKPRSNCFHITRVGNRTPSNSNPDSFGFSLDLRCIGVFGTVSKQELNLDSKLGSRRAMPVMVLRFSGQVGFSEGRTGMRVTRGFCVTSHELSFCSKGKRTPNGGNHHLWKATKQENPGQPGPDEDDPESAPEQEPSLVPGKDAEVPVNSPIGAEAPESDWRTFRARLVVTEQTTISSEPGATESTSGSISVGSLGDRWAHPILAPEAGCVLIATDKIDGQQSFERSVILLLSPGSSNPREGPYGLILNRPLSCRIKDIKPKDRTLVKFFGNCQVHHGGPLDEDMFLLLHGSEGVKGYKEVIPGVYYGAASGLEEIMRGKRPLDYRFFFGYSGWSVEQLKKEVDAGLWCVAACSTDLITGHSAAGLWEEILLLMGGKYAELSKRPRRKHF